MLKVFNVSADCKANLHYMVNINSRLKEIKTMVDRGDYFTINRARQYGKTTTLKALSQYLKGDYIVLHLDFQKLSHENFENETAFVKAISSEVLLRTRKQKSIPCHLVERLQSFISQDIVNLRQLFYFFMEWCEQSEKEIVLIIDEVDSATNNQVFIDFLSQLRGAYIDRDEIKTFHSVILASVYDIKNIKHKIKNNDSYKVNSPWNIAADFLVDMSFSVDDIKGMLAEYEMDYQTGMDIQYISQLIFDYTSGYPFLVSRICKTVDERIVGTQNYPTQKEAWTKSGILEAVKILLSEKNALFESLTNKLNDFTELRELIYALLFTGRTIPYNPLNKSIEIAEMFGFLKNDKGNAVISNRIFETLLYNFFTSEEILKNEMYKVAVQEKNQFIQNGHLDMELILKKFVEHFNDIYWKQEENFLEEVGRRYFLLYLKPIINGVGNYYIEAQTRNMERTDIIVDYKGEQFVIEMKIWRGNSYKERGEKQLMEYLEYYHLKKGYMISFNFNKKKEPGVKKIQLKDKILIEAIV